MSEWRWVQMLGGPLDGQFIRVLSTIDEYYVAVRHNGSTIVMPAKRCPIRDGMIHYYEGTQW